MSVTFRMIRTMALPAALALTLLTLMPVPPLYAAAPCCQIKSIDPRTGTVTIQDLKTGQTSQLKVDQTRLQNLGVGAKVDRNIGTPLRR